MRLSCMDDLPSHDFGEKWLPTFKGKWLGKYSRPMEHYAIG